MSIALSICSPCDSRTFHSKFIEKVAPPEEPLNEEGETLVHQLHFPVAGSLGLDVHQTGAFGRDGDPQCACHSPIGGKQSITFCSADQACDAHPPDVPPDAPAFVVIPFSPMRYVTILSALFLAPIATMAASSTTASDSALAEGDLGGVAIMDDLPYENLANPGVPARAGWRLYTGYSRSEGADTGVSHGLWTTSVGKSWYLGNWTPNLKATWSSEDVSDASGNFGTFLAGMDWAPLESGSFYLQASWTTQEGEDEQTATLGTWWEMPAGEVLSIGLDGSGGWSSSTDWDGHVGIDLMASSERFSLDLGGGWDYRQVNYMAVTGVSGEDYQSVWSALADGRILWGAWSTGPSWSLEYWKAKGLSTQTTTTTPATQGSSWKKNGSRAGTATTAIVPADGASLTQEIAWNLGWTPLRGWSFDLSGFRTFGESSLQVKSSGSSTQSKGRKSDSQTEFIPSSESWGGSASLRISW